MGTHGSIHILDGGQELYSIFSHYDGYFSSLGKQFIMDLNELYRDSDGGDEILRSVKYFLNYGDDVEREYDAHLFEEIIARTQNKEMVTVTSGWIGDYILSYVFDIRTKFVTFYSYGKKTGSAHLILLSQFLNLPEPELDLLI